MVKIVNMLIPKNNTFTRPGIKMTPTSITIHETDNTNVKANALAHARLQVNGNRRQASWHFQVDDGEEAYLSIPMNEVAYHAGSRQGNLSSIAIEICVNRDGNYKKAVKNAVKVVKYIKNKYSNITSENIKQHFNWSGKNCPRQLRAGTQINWQEFLNMIEKTKPGTSTPNKPSQNTLSQTMQTGSKVYLKKTATHYATGEKIPTKYKGRTYTIQQAKADRVLLKELYSWVKKDDVEIRTTSNKTKPISPDQFIKGSKVQLKHSAKSYITGERIPNRIKGKTYTIQQIKGRNILLKEIYSWVKGSDVINVSNQSNKGKRNLKVGQKVKIKRTAKKYSRSDAKIPNRFKGKSYTIQQVGSDDVLIRELYSWVKKSNLE